MPISRIKVILALVREDGLNNAALQDRTGLDQTKISHDVAILMGIGRGRGRFQMLDEERDINDRRLWLRKFSKQGRVWRNRFLNTLSPHRSQQGGTE